VCKYCLTELDWKGYKSKRKGEKKEIFVGFSPSEYFEQYKTSKLWILPTHSPFTLPISNYPKGWRKLSAKLREECGWRCQGCSYVFGKANRAYLHTHHIDGNPGNIERQNLKVLCLECHAREPDHSRLRNLPEYEEFKNWKKRRDD
jgi:5-methylcytosine-specific restriction endonuclease McrA